MQGIAGKVAIVTGASRGIGLGIAQRLVDEGARVCLTARKPEALEEAVRILGGPEHAIAVAGKADDPEHREDAVRRTIETFGSLDLLVNNAGINPVLSSLVEIDLGAARKIVEVNALGALAWVQSAHRAWMGEHGGAVVNISSVSGVKPAPGIAMYGASKAMLISLTESLAVELGPSVRINAVAPAVVKTQFAGPLYEGREDEVAAAYPLKRLGLPEDVAGAVVFLLSDEASWVTGQTLTLDGGLTLTGGV
ncbi:SDR family oxidoreductase [Nocardioides sp. T2.26MG-1]|uniref:SDR family oxidoreductase n=1 Tax=Nocardioides sp. T2.26MG-1 TaxID=3041166 RepID=UPI0024773D3F|nr:SDR family oxidoreductase [Nocardioides sp. T2.26MG-1]CAI9416532.1 3-alpha-hydroxycholanate dehydrogenase (NADP(+)) [Nocardioides sp. T2.26MG-1]